MEDGPLPLKPKSDGHPIQEKNSKVKIAKIVHIVNNEKCIAICKDVIISGK